MRSLIAAACLIAAPAWAQDTQHISFQGAEWRTTAREAVVERWGGQEALRWADGIVWLEDVAFSNGVIEFDLAISGRPGHTGVLWRAQDDNDWEKFYFRHHLSGLPDAVQYTPAFNGVTAWQIYSDVHGTRAFDHRLDDWMRVRVAVNDDRADISVDGEMIFHVPDLKRDEKNGAIGFWSIAPTDEAIARISNVSATADDDVAIAGEALPLAEDGRNDPGMIRSFMVSDEFNEDQLDSPALDRALLESRAWTELDVETNAIANLARVAQRGEGNTVFARTTLTAARAETVHMRFGYSDRVRVYLNGELLYVGDNTWRTRDYRYLGTVTRHIGVPLRLRAGDNDLVFAVSETFGGWAVTAVLDDGADVAVAP